MHPLDACLEESHAFLLAAETEITGLGDDASWNLVQASHWLAAGLEALAELAEMEEEPASSPLRAAAAWLIAHVPSTQKPITFALRIANARREARRRRRVARVTAMPSDGIPYGARHLWDVWTDPQRCLFCETPRTLESESRPCTTNRVYRTHEFEHCDTTLS